MTDTATMPSEVKEELKQVVTMTKRGFDPAERLHKRGLRRATITLFLEEDKGPEIGWVQDVNNSLGQFVRRERVGVIGDIEAVEEERDNALAEYKTALENAKVLETPAAELKQAKKAVDSIVEAANGRIAELTAKRDEMIAELTKTAWVLKLRAVPPVIQKDCRRLARQTLEIASKHVPEDKQDELNDAYSAHLLTKIIQSITDNESGEINTEVTYEDAVEIMGWLPPGQWRRLDHVIGKIQFTDAISQSIEGQEDFS
jgi:hypothetical protein